jgi:L-cysteate sulfo-lyase
MSENSRRDFIKGAGIAALASAVASSGTLSFAQISSKFDSIPRIKLTTLPTACNKMANVSRLIGGPDLYIKRDDVMELAHGGNKTRKLEYAIAEALEKGAKAVITQGGLQSNHVRQTVSGAAKVGLEAHVILSNPVPEMTEELMGSGNYLMDQIMGAHIYVAEDGRGPVVEKVTADLMAAGKNPYNIPAGASNGIGSMGYVNCGRELVNQWNAMGISPSHIFHPTGSCGTQAGLIMGLRYFGNTTTKVMGVSVGGPAEPARQRIRQVLNETSEMMGVSSDFISDDDIIVLDQYYGQAYGYPTEAGIEAIKTVASHEGVITDPVYTGKAMSAMLDMVKNGKLENARDVTFLHTGGAPAIHPYADYFRA